MQIKTHRLDGIRAAERYLEKKHLERCERLEEVLFMLLAVFVGSCALILFLG